MEIAAKCKGITFSFMGGDGEKCFEGVDSLKYLGSFLYRSDEDWLVVCQNIGRARQFWGRLGGLMRR